MFIDASKHYESAKNQNKLRESDIEHIVKTYRDFTAGKLQLGVVEDKYSYVSALSEVAENEYNLNIPRYVDTFEEEVPVDLEAVSNELKSLESDIAETDKTISDFCSELNIKVPYFIGYSNINVKIV